MTQVRQEVYQFFNLLKLQFLQSLIPPPTTLLDRYLMAAD